jgi:hypothetical protein
MRATTLLDWVVVRLFGRGCAETARVSTCITEEIGKIETETVNPQIILKKLLNLIIRYLYVYMTRLFQV